MFFGLATLLDVLGFVGFLMGTLGYGGVSLQLGMELLGSLVSLSLFCFFLHVMSGRAYPKD